MSPAIFALVDLVLEESWREAKNHERQTRRVWYDRRDLVFASAAYAEQLRQHIGWWRSTWVRP